MARFSFMWLLPATAGLWLSLTACAPETPASVPTQPLAYFDLKGFLDGQKAYLESVAPAVTKTVVAGDRKLETKRLARTNWERELAFFYDADLNKPALRGIYTANTTALPGGGTRHTYTRRPGQQGAVRQLTVDLGPQQTVWHIEAAQDDHNLLFSSTRHLSLNCDPAPDRNRILSYEVAGQQKLIFFDEMRFAVKGEIE